MTTIQTTLGAAVDAIQRVPVSAWLADTDDPQGFPNYPLFVDDSKIPQQTMATATACLWDAAFGRDTALLLAAIGADPSRIPVDTSDLDRAALLALYGAEVAAAKAAQETP